MCGILYVEVIFYTVEVIYLNAQLLACVIVLMLLCIGCAAMLRLYLYMAQLTLPLVFKLLCVVLIILIVR